ncbi:MAG: DUF4230 domain-containing protein [Anaerolineae bacterium]
MNTPRPVTIILLVVLLSGLVTAVGVIAYRYGQRMALAVGAPTPAAIIPPTATATAPPPPPIVTNTPTVTATPTATSGPTNTPTSTPTSTASPTPTPIIFDIRDLGRLETTEFAMRTVIDLENDPSNLWQEIVGTDKLMLVAEGEVVAGFDLQKIDPQKDIHAQGTTVKITLPAAEILYSRIDNEKTYVYERKTGLLTQPDPTLESRARLLAEKNLTEWAEGRGIRQKAEAAGRVYLENFLRSLGFTKITIEVKKKGI